MSSLQLASLLPWLVSLPLLAAIVSFVLPGGRSCRWFCSAAAAIHLSISMALLLLIKRGMDAGGAVYNIGGWGAPLGIDLHVDGFSALMIMLTNGIAFILTLYGAAYFTDTRKQARFWPLWWLLITALNCLYLAADAFNIYVALEIMGLASVALVALQGTVVALRAALRYLLAGLLGSLCYLLGVALLYRSYGVLDLAALGQRVLSEPLSWAALGVITVGLLLKTALLPLHFWLPSAHASAPAPVSAALSALVVKASFYLLVVFWLEVMPSATSYHGLQLLGALGAAAIVVGSLQAIRAQRLKLIVAYSTVAQLGYLFLLFPLVGEPLHSGNSLGGAAISAIIYFIIAHAFAKAAMFLSVGNIQHVVGHDKLTGLNAIARYMPLSLAAFAIAGVSLIGLPPSGGFIAKWLLLNLAIDSGQWWWAVAILGGGLLAAVYVFRVINFAFNDADSQLGADGLFNTQGDGSTAAPRLPRMLSACAFTLAVVAIVLGFTAPWLLSVPGVSFPGAAGSWGQP